MPLRAPNLDDRRFQDLVDDGKRLVQQKCPEWTDHNVSDPGVTMIEVFAFIADQLIYRLNQVPDRLYVKFLELLGVELAPPVAARTEVTFWLSAPQPEVVRVLAGTKTATVRTETDPAILFTVVEDLAIVPCSLAHLMASAAEGDYRSLTELLQFDQGALCFSEVPKPGDALLIGLSDAVPSCAVNLRFDCDIAEGHGIDPRNPPLVWEALDGERWSACVVDRDDTGGLNRPGDVVLHVPRLHAPTVLADQRAGWLRCRVVEPHSGQPPYARSPEIKGLTAFTSGGTARAVNAEVIDDEVVGTSNGLSGQRFRLKHQPVVEADEPAVIEIESDDEPWQEVDTFTDSDGNDHHFRLDRASGEVVFGPAVREPEGGLTMYGAVPRANRPIRIRTYRTGGGTGGNVAAGAIKMLKSSIPYVARVENRTPGSGGTDGETLENAKVRGPMVLRGTRAVAARDFEHQAIQAAPEEVARVLCLPAGSGSDPGAVRVLITPSVPDDPIGRLPFDELTPLRDDLLQRITSHLENRRVVGVRIVVEPPLYMGLTIEAKLHAEPRSDPKRVQEDALEALYRYFHPISGGPDGSGWAFGRPVHGGEAFWVLQRVSGVLYVEEARLYPSNPLTGQRGATVERLELEPNALVFSYEHGVEVVTDAAS
jgi:predicted phage baseplate assembly protein